jgi:hypothetical protein
MDTTTKPNTKVLANGTVYDMDKKRIVSGPEVPPFCRPEVRQKALETRAANKALAALGATRGIIAAANTTATPEQRDRIARRGGGDAVTALDDAMECVVENIAETVILNPDAHAAARSRALEVVSKQADLMPGGSGDDDRPHQTLVINMSNPEAEQRIGAILQRYLDGIG